MRSIFLSFLLIKGFLLASYLTHEDIETYYSQGYIVKRGAIEPDLIRRMEVKSVSLLQRLDKKLAQIEQKIELDGTQVVFGGQAAIKRLTGVGSIEPDFHLLVCSDKMLNSFFALLGTNKIEKLICQFHPKVPGDGVSFVKHRDIRYRKEFDPNWEDIGGNGSYAICIIAIDPMFYENGGLVIDKKSFPPGCSNESEPVALTMEPGDILFMHPELFHWSEANRSTISRKTLLAGYCIYGANHCNYPGNCTNDVFVKEEGKILSFPAPWKKVNKEDK